MTAPFNFAEASATITGGAVPRADLGSFAFRRTDDAIQYELQRRSRSGDNVDVYMPSIRLATTVNVGMINEEYKGCEYFCVGTHGYPQNPSTQDSGLRNDVLMDLFNLTEGNYPIVGYTVSTGTTKLIRAKDESARNLSIPPPGVESLIISRNTNGRITKLTGVIVVPSYAQYEELSKYFLIPGVGVLAEVANIYTHNSTGLQTYPSFVNLGDFRADDGLFDMLHKNTSIPFVPLEKILDKSIASEGAYTAFFGRMSNFKTSLKGTAYTIEFECVGVGDASMGISMYEPLTQNATDAIQQTNTQNAVVRDWFVPSSENKLSPFYDLLISQLNVNTSDPTTTAPEYSKHVQMYSYGPTLKATKDELVKEKLPNDLSAVTSLVGGYENPIFISWPFFVNVVLNDPALGVRSCYLDDKLAIKLIHKLDDYKFNSSEKSYDSKYEPLIGSHPRLRSTNVGVMIIYNERAQNCVTGDATYKNLVGDAIAQSQFDSRYTTLGDFHRYPPINAGTLSHGVWLNANNIVEIFKESNTIHQALTTLLTQMNHATGNYWNLALDFDEAVLSDFIITDINFVDASGTALQKAYRESYIFNQPFVVEGNKLISGSGVLSIDVDVALKASLVATAVFANADGAIGHAGSQLSAFSNKGKDLEYPIWEYDITRKCVAPSTAYRSKIKISSIDGGILTYSNFAMAHSPPGISPAKSLSAWTTQEFDKVIDYYEKQLRNSPEERLRDAIINNDPRLKLDPIRGIPLLGVDPTMPGALQLITPVPQTAGTKISGYTTAAIKKYIDNLKAKIGTTTTTERSVGNTDVVVARVSQPYKATVEEQKLITLYDSVAGSSISEFDKASYNSELRFMRDAKRRKLDSASGTYTATSASIAASANSGQIKSIPNVDGGSPAKYAQEYLTHLTVIFGMMELMPAYMSQQIENSVKYDINNNFGFNGSLPIKVGVTLPGIGGFRSGEIIRIARLPDPYTEAAFLILGTTDSITSDTGWVTSIEAKYLPKTMFDARAKPKSPPNSCGDGVQQKDEGIIQNSMRVFGGPPKQDTPNDVYLSDILSGNSSPCPQLLELIAQYESGNAGYDTINFKPNYKTATAGTAEYLSVTGGKLISRMTLDEIQFATSNGPLFAIGKYQVIPNTLAAAIDSLGLKGDQLFNAQTQERIVGFLLSPAKSRYAVDSYLTDCGFNDMDAAMLDLAQEFQAFPLPDRPGVSFYKNDDGSDKLTRLQNDQVRSVLAQCKAAKNCGA